MKARIFKAGEKTPDGNVFTAEALKAMADREPHKYEFNADTGELFVLAAGLPSDANVVINIEIDNDPEDQNE